MSKLSTAQEANNAAVGASRLLLLPLFVWFCIKINIAQAKPRGPAWPTHFAIGTAGHPPHEAARILKSYGIRSHSWGAVYQIIDGHIRLVESIAISSRQANWADKLLAVGDWDIYSKQRSNRDLKQLPKQWTRIYRNFR